VCGKAVPEGVRANRFHYSGALGRPAHRFLQAALVDVMAAGDAGRTRVGAEAVGRKCILPAPFCVGVGIFALQSKGEVDGSITFFQITLVQLFDSGQVRLKRLAQLVGQHGDAVFHAFAFADDDLALGKVEVFDSQANAFHEAQTASIEYLCRQLVIARHLAKDGLDFVFSEDDGQAFRFLGSHDGKRLVNVQLQHIAIEKKDGADGLGLGGGGDVLLGGKVGEEGIDFGSAHGLRVALVMEEDISLGPIHVAGFSADGVVADAQGVAHLLKERFLLRRLLRLLADSGHRWLRSPGKGSRMGTVPSAGSGQVCNRGRFRKVLWKA